MNASTPVWRGRAGKGRNYATCTDRRVGRSLSDAGSGGFRADVSGPARSGLRAGPMAHWTKETVVTSDPHSVVNPLLSESPA